MIIGRIGNSKFIKKMEYVVPLKHDTKKTPFLMSSNKLFLNYGLKYYNWVRQSVMKSVDAVAFQKIKEMR